MVWPIVIGAGIAVGSGIAQWMQSERARKASASERAQMKNLLDRIEEPGFDFSNFSPEDYKVVAQFIPETIPYVEAAAPEIAKESEAALRGRQSELDALDQLRGIATSGSDPIERIARERSARRAAANAQSARSTTDQLMQRRGMGGGSGLAYASNLQGASDAYQADALAGEEAVANSTQRRDSAIRDSASLGGRVADSENDMAFRNAQVLNDFNRWATQNRQNYMQTQADTRNRGQLFNVENAQNVANKNVDVGNQYGWLNKTRGDNLKQDQFNNSMSKATGQVRQGEARINDIYADAAQKNQAIQGVSQAAGATVDRYQKYDDAEEAKKAKLTRGQAGVY